MNLDELSATRFITAAMVIKPMTVTVKSVDVERVGAEDQPVMHFDELQEGLVLKKTNRDILRIMFKTGDTEEMVGKQVELYRDPRVRYGNKFVAGVRIRPVREG